MCAYRPSKEQWLKEAEEAYERAFGAREKDRDRPPTFSELEEEACDEGDRLTRWLLEKKLATESADCGSAARPCPHCGKLCEARDGDSQERRIVSRRGQVPLGRYGYECRKCRRVFFPSGPPT